MLLIAGVFLALVLVHLWLGAQDTGPESEQRGPQLSRIELPEDQEQVEITDEGATADARGLIESRIYLLEKGERNERRATAIQLAYLTEQPEARDAALHLDQSVREQLRRALLKGLNDPDEVVSENCRDALLALWRTCDSLAVTEQFREGLRAYRMGQFDEALKTFQSAEGLRGSVPPDLYRMEAQIYLARSMPEEALAACRRALELEPRNFYALLVVAHLHERQGDVAKAVRALDTALRIYSRFDAASEMREKLADRRAAS
jgi:tetratricopeptide (TPR) repeat protein